MRTVGVHLWCPECGSATDAIWLELGGIKPDLIDHAFKALANAADPRPWWDDRDRPHCPRCEGRLRLVRSEVTRRR